MMPIFAEGLHISIAAEPIFHVGPLAVTNSMIMGIFGYLFVLIWLSWVARKAKTDDGKKKGFFTRLVIWCFTALYNTTKEIIPNKKIRDIIAPFAISLFFFIAIQYYVGILPFVGDAITWNGTPLFRGANADLNLTFAMAIMTIVLIQILATIKFGLKGNIARFIRNPIKNPIGFFEGILELIAEFSRLVALSMRLFGNVFAGEILILIIVWLTQFATPLILPFIYIFEMFIGGIQAYVFFSLAVAFAGLAVAGHDHASPSTESEHQLIPKTNKVAEGVH